MGICEQTLVGHPLGWNFRGRASRSLLMEEMKPHPQSTSPPLERLLEIALLSLFPPQSVFNVSI